MPPVLFTPLALRGLTLSNRIVVSPMSQYCAEDGAASDWHLMHLGQFAISGAGLYFTEQTAVTPAGRLGPGALALYDDRHEAALKRVVGFCKAAGAGAFGVQLGDCGRKGPTRPWWDGGKPLSAEDGGWTPVAASALRFDAAFAVPEALDAAGLARVCDAHADAVRRAARAGVDAIELQASHGYFLHGFLSPLANRRTDEYGGAQANRMRYPLAVFAAMRAAWPAEKPLGIRLSAVDGAEGGWVIEDTLALVAELDGLGCDFVDVSSGGIAPGATLPGGPGYQAALAAAVKSATRMAVMAEGGFTTPEQAETVVRSGQADLVGLAKPMLGDPRWAWKAAEALGGKAFRPPPYRTASAALEPKWGGWPPR